MLSHTVKPLMLVTSDLAGCQDAVAMAKAVVGDEIIDWLSASLEPIEVSDETLALDLIDEVGPDGHFIDTDHTLDHFRRRWYPTLFDRCDYPSWLEGGEQDLGQRAAERVEEILARHHPEPLPRAVRGRLREIVETEQRAAS